MPLSVPSFLHFCSASPVNFSFSGLLVFLRLEFFFFFFFNSIYTSVSLPVVLRDVVESFVFLHLGLLLLFVFVLDLRLECKIAR